MDRLKKRFVMLFSVVADFVCIVPCSTGAAAKSRKLCTLRTSAWFVGSRSRDNTEIRLFPYCVPINRNSVLLNLNAQRLFRSLRGYPGSEAGNGQVLVLKAGDLSSRCSTSYPTPIHRNFYSLRGAPTLNCIFVKSSVKL